MAAEDEKLALAEAGVEICGRPTAKWSEKRSPGLVLSTYIGSDLRNRHALDFFFFNVFARISSGGQKKTQQKHVEEIHAD